MAIALVMSRQPERRPYIWRTLVSGGRASDPRERTEGQGGPWGGVAKGRGADMAKKGKLSRRSFLARVAGAAAMTGAASIVTPEIASMVTIDNGTTAPGQNSAEFGVTIAMADQVITETALQQIVIGCTGKNVITT